MIGDGWDGDPSARPGTPEPARRVRIAVVTGSRAEFGLLTPVMRAIAATPTLELIVFAAGSHLIQPALTLRDVKALFPIADSVPMQIAGRLGRNEDAQAVGTGISRFARIFASHNPDWVVVLGDRIEAFAAAAAANIGGYLLAHIHGGDRAEGVADEAMRHAITKLSHVHFPATKTSADRIIKMGERADKVHVVGSSAIDELSHIEPMTDEAFAEVGSPGVLFLMHPVGRHAEMEEAAATETLAACKVAGKVLALAPNFDPGRDGITRAIRDCVGIKAIEHMPRAQFVALLKRMAASGGIMVGNSSAALIEAAALKLPAVNIGHRQLGRERAGNVIDAADETLEGIGRAIAAAKALDRTKLTHPYGDGHAGLAIARILAATRLEEPGLRRKLNAY